MTRTQYRMLLSTACALAAFAGPIVFMEDKALTGYLLGGLGAALLTWAFTAVTQAAEPHISPLMQGVLGAGAAVLSWATISIVAVFDVIPHIVTHGLARFDPVWLMGGLAPLPVLGVAGWRAMKRRTPVWHALCTALYRYSVPLFGLHLVVQVLPLPERYPWLILFTGVMFVVLDDIFLRAENGLTRQPGGHNNTTKL